MKIKLFAPYIPIEWNGNHYIHPKHVTKHDIQHLYTVYRFGQEPLANGGVVA